ncbi:MAG: DUF4258 domain-containing protein [Candidatus Tectomicrobia bacterium]|nr:DUF4258 domain-containing protein [Candidatus Tectomicrobia bacterium]
MFERGITRAHVPQVLSEGEVIAGYPEDEPYPGRLLLGFAGGEPLHVVAASDSAGGTLIVVTVYRPDAGLWEPGFRRRRT